MDVELARDNMLGQQVRAWEVLDPEVLEVLGSVPREAFVPDRYRNLAFAELPVPLGGGDAMMTPRVEGRMLQALGLRRTDHVLEIGTGSGFVTACLARLAGSVSSLDDRGELTERARVALARLGTVNVTLATRDGSRVPDGAPRYDAICITGSMPALEPSFLRHLAIGGRLFAVVGDPPTMAARLVTRVAEDGFSTEVIFETSLPPLRNAHRTARFEL